MKTENIQPKIEKYTRPKEYPRFFKNVAGAVGLAIGGLAALHVGTDISHLFSIPLVDHTFQLFNDATSTISHVAENIPYVGSGINMVHEVAVAEQSFLADSLLSNDTLAFASAAITTRMGVDVANAAWTANRKDQYFEDKDRHFIQAAEKIVAALKLNPHTKNTADNLDISKIIKEVVSADSHLSKLKVHWTAFLAQPFSLFVGVSTDKLIDIVLEREAYDGVKGNIYNQLHALALGNDGTKLVDRVIGVGELTDTGNELLRITSPKKTIFNGTQDKMLPIQKMPEWVHDGGGGGTSIMRIIGGATPGVTGEDADGAMTIALRRRMGREKEGSPLREKFNRVALQKATIIAGDRVKGNMSKYALK